MSITPMMQQYLDIKKKYGDCILFFRVGDFYEMFFDDALVASKDMEVTLTKRAKTPMCGVPHHSADVYIAKLLDKGHKIAICEQTEDLTSSRGLFKREVVKIITAGTILNPELLSSDKNNYIASVQYDLDKNKAGLAFCDISTGEIAAYEMELSQLQNEISCLGISELLISDDDLLFYDVLITKVRKPDESHENIKRQFKEPILKDKNLAKNALEALLDYLFLTQKADLSQLGEIKDYDPDLMNLDFNTIRNLELIETNFERKKEGSLLGVLDKTETGMGARLIKQWIKRPLKRKEKIEKRLLRVECLTEDFLLRNDLKTNLKDVYDLERLTARLATNSATHKDLFAIKRTVDVLPEIKALLSNHDLFNELNEKITDLFIISDMIDKTLEYDEELKIREGCSKELDDIKHSIKDGQDWLIGLEESERKRTGIKNLRVGFNKVFGYYIDVTRSNLDLVPDDYIRKQTLVNNERYITEELKKVETLIFNAEAKIEKLENDIFNKLKEDLRVYINELRQASEALAEIDVLCSLSDVSAENNYVKPTFTDDYEIIIKDGRHPVLEKIDRFIPNDAHLNREDRILEIITGPNMSGKSTYMRQIALIVLMAQMGCFVPATTAEIGIVDGIFTRIGASDNLSKGQSTFFVEMSELADILKNATERSLLILDEIGRGTSTYDGISIAFALIEYLLEDNRKIRTLFSTHYHELTNHTGKMKGAHNLTIDIIEEDGKIVFLHKIIEGSANKSYGIHVARLAGVPEALLIEAEKHLIELEKNELGKNDN